MRKGDDIALRNGKKKIKTFPRQDGHPKGSATEVSTGFPLLCHQNPRLSLTQYWTTKTNGYIVILLPQDSITLMVLLMLRLSR
jgi:hypothetical protein